MNMFDEPLPDIRQFLLGQLPKGETARIEDRIFAEEGFAEEVRIVEEELIADYRAGDLNPQDRASFEQQYLTTPAGRQAVEFEAVFDAFIQSTLEKTEPDRAADVAASTIAPIQLDTTTSHGTAPAGSPVERRPSRLRAFFARQPGLAYASLCVGLLLLAAGLWSLSRSNSNGPPADDPLQVARRDREKDLARLNRGDEAPAGVVAAAADLEPTQRADGSMARVVKGRAEDGLIQLRLNLTQTSTPPYRAVFLNDRGEEMFAVSNPPTRSTPGGTHILLFVPAGYFTHGDYRIDLSATGRSGYERLNSYAFRVVEHR